MQIRNEFSERETELPAEWSFGVQLSKKQSMHARACDDDDIGGDDSSCALSGQLRGTMIRAQPKERRPPSRQIGVINHEIVDFFLALIAISRP